MSTRRPPGSRSTEARARLVARRAVFGLVSASLWLAVPASGRSDPPADPPAAEASEAAGPISVEQLARRLELLERRNAELAEENRSLSSRLGEVNGELGQLRRRLEAIEPDDPDGLPPALTPDPTPTPAEPLPTPPIPTPPDPRPGGGFRPGIGNAPEDPAETGAEASRFLVGGYDDDRGQFVVVRPRSEDLVPFELRIDLFTQARYLGFSRASKTWIDSTGTPRPIQDISAWEIPRNFLVFSGFGIDPRLQYTAVIFSSTSINDTVYLGWINYRFNDALDVRVGNWLVPGTREWYDSFRYTLGADRLMATTFFRPNISPGIWAQGEPIENLHYVAMFANSVNRFNQGSERLGSAGAFGGTVWWEPNGDFGVGPSDLEYHERPSFRFGFNTALSRERNQGLAGGVLNRGNPEDTILRLSDGTPLFREGALGPGVVLETTDVQLFTVDAAVKYRGFGLSGEYFFRLLDDFDAVGAPPAVDSLFDHGALAQGGYFLIPRHLELFARSSFVTGPFGSGSEVGGGLNWYVRGTRDWRLTFEVLKINHSPAQNILTGYRAGESGTLFQLQWFTDF